MTDASIYLWSAYGKKNKAKVTKKQTKAMK